VTTADQTHLEQDSLDILAGEFVLGTLNETARRQCTLLAAANPAFSDRIRFWQATLAPLALTPVPVSPLSDLWQQIARLTIDTPKPHKPQLPVELPTPMAVEQEYEEGEPEVRSPGFWRPLAIGFACVALALAGTIGVLLDRSGSWQSHRFAVLVDPERQPLWLARTDAGGRQLEIAPIRRVTMPPDQSFQLWLTTGPNTAALSLGPLNPAGQVIPKLPSSFAQARELVVSIEPLTGSPNGQPSGTPSAVGTLVDPSESIKLGR
jgi:anti-sigma-K factor RskA